MKPSGISQSSDSRPAVSIIVPVYNRLEYLSGTLQSILAQSFDAWELVVVDDGSQEDVAALVTAYRDPRIRIFRQENQGNAAARNSGISLTFGDYVACLDSDDTWEPDFLRMCIAELTNQPEIDVVYTQVRYVDEHGESLSISAGPMPLSGDLLEPLLMGHPILPSSALVRRTCFERWGSYTPGLDDWELWLRWSARGCRFACLTQPLLNYRIHTQNFSADYERRRSIHLAMLDAFYAQDPIPEAARRLRAHAYATQFLRFAVLAWQTGRQPEGIADFVAAVLHHPSFLTALDFYIQIASAHQERRHVGTPHGLNLEVAEATLLRCLAGLFNRPDLPEGIRMRQKQAYGWAYMGLARLAYGIAHDSVQARDWLWQAARLDPALILHSDWSLWLSRSMIRYDRLQRVKRGLRVKTQDG